MGKKFSKARTEQVAVVRLDGPIGIAEMGKHGVNTESVEPVLKKAFATERLRAVVVVVNSPGGSPAQSEYIAERIRQLSAEKGVPVLAFCEDVAASGGYWIACAADEIFAASRLDERFQAEKWGADAEALARERRIEADFAVAARYLVLLGTEAA